MLVGIASITQCVTVTGGGGGGAVAAAEIPFCDCVALLTKFLKINKFKIKSMRTLCSTIQTKLHQLTSLKSQRNFRTSFDWIGLDCHVYSEKFA